MEDGDDVGLVLYGGGDLSKMFVSCDELLKLPLKKSYVRFN